MIAGEDGTVASEKLNDDGTGYVYIAPKARLQLETHLESCSQVYYEGALAIQNNGTSKFAIKRHFDNYGAIHGTDRIDIFYGSNGGNWTMHPTSTPRWIKLRSLTVKENSGIILASDGNEIGWRIEADSDKNIEFEAGTFLLSTRFETLRGKRISFQTGSRIMLNNQSGLNSSLMVENMLIDGIAELGTVTFGSSLRTFHVGTSGRVSVNTALFSLNEFLCNGTMSFINDVAISSDIWTVDSSGNVIFANTTKHVILQAHTVKVQGIFNPGKLSTGTGWQLLNVGPGALFTFSSNTTVIIDILDIAGTVRINGTIELQKRDYSGKSLVTIANGGKFILDEYSPCVNSTKYSGTSQLLALNVTVNGLFHVGKMSLGPGWDNLMVGPSGDVAFIPAGHVKIDRIKIEGKFRTDTTTVIKSKTTATEEMETFEILSSGSVELNCAPDTETSLTSNTSFAFERDHASQLFAKEVRIDGSFVTRKLYIGLGWDLLTIGTTGSFTVHPIGWFSFDVFTVYGKLTSQARLEIQGKSSIYLARMHVGTLGHFKSAPNASDIFVDELIVDGRFETGLLSIGRGIYNLTVNGRMTFNHEKDFRINTTIINGTLETWTPFTSLGRFIGELMDIKGVMKINYQGAPQQDGGLTPSVMIIDTVLISGSALFGSLDLTSKSVSVSGLLSADYGGAMTNKGTGRYQVIDIF